MHENNTSGDDSQYPCQEINHQGNRLTIMAWPDGDLWEMSIVNEDGVCITFMELFESAEQALAKGVQFIEEVGLGAFCCPETGALA